MDSFIGWVGGKKALRDIIISNFPEKEPKRYIEVFGGAGWVLFRKEQISGQMEVFNDRDSCLVNLYRCIKYHPEELKRELDGIFSSRELFYDFKDQCFMRGMTDIQRAARYFYLIKISFGCKKDTFATRPKRLDRVMDRYDEIKKRLSGVIIENRDFEDIIRLYDNEDALFYIDPPYHSFILIRLTIQQKTIIRTVKGSYLLRKIITG